MRTHLDDIFKRRELCQRGSDRAVPTAVKPHRPGSTKHVWGVSHAASNVRICYVRVWQARRAVAAWIRVKAEVWERRRHVHPIASVNIVLGERRSARPELVQIENPASSWKLHRAECQSRSCMLLDFLLASPNDTKSKSI